MERWVQKRDRDVMFISLRDVSVCWQKTLEGHTERSRGKDSNINGVVL